MDESERRWAERWLARLVDREGREVTAEGSLRVERAVEQFEGAGFEVLLGFRDDGAAWVAIEEGVGV